MEVYVNSEVCGIFYASSIVLDLQTNNFVLWLYKIYVRAERI